MTRFGIPLPADDTELSSIDPLSRSRDAISDVRSIGQTLRQNRRPDRLSIGSPEVDEPDESPTPATNSPIQIGRSLGFVSLSGEPSPQPNAAPPSAPSAIQGGAGQSLGFVSLGAGILPSSPSGEEEQGFLSGIGTALVEGTQQTVNRLGASGSTLVGSDQGVVDSAKYAGELEKNSQAQALKKLKSDIARDKEGNDTLWGGIKNVVGNMWDNKTGGAELIAEQTPNTLVALGTGYAGMKAGAAVGGSVGAAFGGVGAVPGAAIGGTVGFIAGLFGANSLLEIGGKAQEKAADGDFTAKDRSEAISEGTTKGAVITAVDTATLGASKFILGASSRAVERATVKTLDDLGYDSAKITGNILDAQKLAMETAKGMDDVAGRAFVEKATLESMVKNGLTKPDVVKAVQASQKRAYDLANGVGTRLGRGTGVVGLETLGEGLGEYLGELAATGEASPTDAIMEAVAGFSQSMTEIYASSKMTKPGTLTKATNVDGITPAEETKGTGSTAKPDATESTPERPANVPTDFVYDQAMSVWRGQTDAEKQAAQTESGFKEPTKLSKGINTESVMIEKALEIEQGVDMLAAMWANGDQAQREIARQVAERAGKLDEFNNATSSEETPAIERGRQMMSDAPQFGADFVLAAQEYATTQPAPRKVPKKDRRKDAVDVAGMDEIPTGDVVSETDLQAIKDQMANDQAEADLKMNQSTSATTSQATDTQTKPADDIKPMANKMNVDGVILTENQNQSNQTVENIIESGGDSLSVLNAIATSNTVTPFQKLVAKILSGFDINPSVKFGDLATDNKTIIGYYKLGMNEIVIDRANAGDLVAVFLHEYVHAMTRSSTLLKTKAGKQIQALYKKFEKFKGEDSEYGFTDADEFVAEALTNEKFQNLLKTMKVEGIVGQLWNRIVEIFSKVLGIKNKDVVEKLLDATYSAAVEQPSNRAVLRETGIESPDAAMVAPKREDVEKAKSEARIAGMGTSTPERQVEATAKKAETDADALANLESFTAATRKRDEAERASKMARAEYAKATPTKDAQGRDTFDPAIADRVAKADAEAKVANAEYESAVRKLEGIPEGKPLPEKYQERVKSGEMRFSSEEEAKASAESDIAKAKQSKDEVRKQFIDQLVSGDFSAAIQTWNEYFPVNPQFYDESGKSRLKQSEKSYRFERYNKMVEAMRWVYKKTNNAGIKRMLDATWKQKQAYEVQRKSFLWNMTTNQLFAGLIDSAILDVREGKGLLIPNANEMAKLPRVKSYANSYFMYEKTPNGSYRLLTSTEPKEGFKKLTEAQKKLLVALINQTDMNSLRGYYDANFFRNATQGDLDITTESSEAIKKFEAQLDYALNQMYSGADRELDSDTEGEKIVKAQNRAKSMESMLQKMRDQQAALYALANQHSRGAVNDESGYLIAMMTPEGESFNTDEVTSSEFALEGATLETKFNFDPLNVDRDAIMRMASELGQEIRRIQEKRLESKAELYQTLGNQMAFEIFQAKAEAQAAGLPSDFIDEKYRNAMKTLVVGLSVRLKGKTSEYLFRDESEIWGTMNAQRGEPSEAQIDSAFQGDLFSEKDLERSDAQNAIRLLIDDVKTGTIEAGKAYDDVMSAIREGQMTIMDVRNEFKRQGVAVPVETINAMARLPMRKKLRDHISEHGGDRLYFEEWMTQLDAIATPDVLNRITAEERQAYDKWKSAREKMQTRIMKLKPHEEYNSAVWVFSDLLFANYTLDQMRNPSLIKDEGERAIIRSLFADPVTAWHQDIQYAKQTRGDLIDQVISPTGGIDAMVTPADSIAHLEWLRIREASAERDIRVSGDIKDVKSLLENLAELRGIPQSAVEDRVVEKVVYFDRQNNEVPADTDGATPVSVKVNMPGLASILYRTAPTERRAVLANWIAINSVKNTKGQADTETDGIIDDLIQEDLYKSKSADQIAQEEVDRSWYDLSIRTGFRKDWVDDGQADTKDESASETEYETALREAQEEAGAWEQEDSGTSPMDSDRLRQGAYSGVVNAAFLTRWVRDLTQEWKSAPNISVLESHHQLPEPLRSRVSAKLGRNMGAKGLFDGETNTVYMFSDYINGETDAEFTLFHEVFGHYGMRGLLGKEFDTFLTTQFKTNQKVRALAELKMAEGMSMLEAVDEVLSDFTAQIESPATFRMYLGKVINGLRKIGLGKVADWFNFLTSAELSYVLEASKRGVKNGDFNFQGMPDTLRLADQKNPYELFAVKDGKTRGYARYNPILDQWYVFVGQGEDIRSGNYNSYSSSDYNAVLKDMQRLGKVEARMRSSRFIDDKIPADFVRLPKLADLTGWKRRFNLLRQYTQNEYTPVFNLVEELVRTGRMSKNFDIKTALTLYERKTAVEVEDYNKRFVQPVVDALERLRKRGDLKLPKFDVNGQQIETVNDLVNVFLNAEHAEERNKQINKVNPNSRNGSGMDTQTAKRILSFVRNQPYFSDLLEISSKLDELSDFKLDLEVSRGLISRTDAANRKGAYKHYRNLSGVRATLDEDGSDDPSLNVGRRFNLRGTDKRAMGRGDIAPDILARTLVAGEASVIRSNKNLIAQKVLALFETNYDPNFVVINEVASARVINKETQLVETQDDPNYLKRPDVMIAKVNGIPIAMRFKEQGFGSVGEALHGSMAPRESHPIFEAMGKYNKFFGQLLTTYNPAWIFVNFVRDVQTMYSNAAADGRISRGMARQMLRELPSSMKASIHIALSEFKPKTKVGKVALAGIKTFMKIAGKPNPQMLALYKQARLDGALTSFIDRKGLEDQIIEIDRALNGVHGVDAAMQKVKGLLHFVELLSIPTELAPRLAAYKVMRQNGFTQDQAAVFSGEITVNFNMRGTGKELRQMYLFFNPAVQGTAKMMKLAKNDPAKFAKIAVAWAGLGMVMNLIGRAMGGDDEDKINKMDKLPPLKRATSAVWAPDSYFGAIPIAYGYNAFYSFGHFLTDSIVAGIPMKTTMRRIASTTFESFSPIGNGAFESDKLTTTLQKLALPTFTAPLVEWSSNENRFGAPIYKSPNAFGGARDPDTYMNFDSANPLSVATMRAIHNLTGGSRFNRDGVDINPEAMDFVIESYLPGVINESYKTVGLIARKAQGLDIPKQKLPLIGRFQSDVPEQWDAGAFRKVSDIVEERYREYIRTNSDARKLEIIKERPGLLEAHQQIADVTQAVRERRALLEKLRYSGADKAEIIEYENRFKKEEKELYKMSTKLFMQSGFRNEILGDK